MKFEKNISERVKYFYEVAQEWMKSGVGTDVSIFCGLDSSKTVFYCHRFMIRTFLLQQCGYQDMAEVDQIILPETDPNIFLKYLNFVYGFQTTESNIIFDKNMENSIEDILAFANSYVKVKLENEQESSEDDDEEYKCNLSPKKKEYPEPMEVKLPTSTVEGTKKSYKCSYCGKEFSRSDHLNRHIVTHTGQKQFQCDFCGKEFARKDKLKLHKSSAHNTSEEQKHFCSCGQEFINEYDFYDHKQENPDHTKINNSSSNPQNGIKKETSEDLTQCGTNSNFRQIGGKKLVFKIKKVKGKKKLKKKNSTYPCKYCDVVFQYAKDRKTHSLEVHWSELKERGLIFNHNNTVNIKNFHCDFENCDRSFRHRCEKNDHIAAVHRGEKNYVCEICSKAFPYRKSLKIHMELKHNDGPMENILCTQCGGVFPSKLKLQIHIDCAHKIKIKKFLCKFCDFKTHAKNVITEHERTHTGEKPEICAWCGKGFNAKKTLKNHERLHTGEKPYKCQHCDNCFAQRTSLNVHMQSHHKDILATQPSPLKTKNFSPIKPDPGQTEVAPEEQEHQENFKSSSPNSPSSPTSPPTQYSQSDNEHSPSLQSSKHNSEFNQPNPRYNPPPPLQSPMYDQQRHQFGFDHLRSYSAEYEQQLQQQLQRHSQINHLAHLSQLSPGYHSSDPRLRYEPHQESSP